MLLAGSTHNFVNHFGSREEAFPHVIEMTQVQDIKNILVRTMISFSLIQLDTSCPSVFLYLSLFLEC
jgi:hypothetical protein